MAFFGGKRKEKREASLETGSEFRIPVNFRIPRDFPEKILLGTRAGEFARHMKNFLKQGLINSDLFSFLNKGILKTGI